jgi:hypothetical protein
VKSRIFTPSSALPAWPKGLLVGFGSPPFLCAPFFARARAATFFGADFFFAAFALAFVFFRAMTLSPEILIGWN